MRNRFDLDNDLDVADPKGRSNHRRSHRGNMRCLPCPTCRQPNRLTESDRRQGYQCNECADRDEGEW